MDQKLIAGDTLTFTTEVADYPATDGWTLTYRLVPVSGGSAITITATASGASYLVGVAAADTANWTAGLYAWSAYVTKSTNRFVVDDGMVQIVANPQTIAAGTDTRSHARKVLAAIEAVLEGRATKDQEEYQIAGRRLKRTPIPDLLNLRAVYRREVRAELAAERLQAGEDVGYTLQVRL